MVLPLALIVLALVSAAFAAYGTAAQWASRWGPSGEQIIYLSRRLQWPVLTVCVLSCVALLLLVVTGKRRVFWLIGLAPVLALFAHRFSTSPMRDFRVAESPPMVAVDQVPADLLLPEEWVVGVVIAPAAGSQGAPEIQAYPYAALWRSPVVVQSALDQRFILVWNPFANFARAYQVDRDINPRELEVVSMPVNALLVYNARYGEFINGVTGLQPGGKAPTGFGRELSVQAMSWARWRAMHPSTKVMLPPPRSDTLAVAAAVPVRPRYAIPPATRPAATDRDTEAPGESGPGTPEADLAAGQDSPLGDNTVPIETPVLLLSTVPPVVILPTDLSDTPANLPSGSVVFRDSRWGRARAYVRSTGGTELRLAPFPAHLKKPAGAAMVDVQSLSAWSESGRNVDAEGTMVGRSLEPIGVFEGGYFEVLRYWMPGLKVHHVTAADFAEVAPPPPPPPPQRRAPARRTPARR